MNASRRAAAALIALVTGLGLVSFAAPVPDAIRIAALALLMVIAVAGGTVLVAGWREPTDEEEFDRIVERAERLAEDADEDAGEPEEDDWESAEEELFDPWREEDFQAIVRGAVDDLPLEFHRALEHVAIVVNDGGRRRRAYGLYQGGTVSRDHFHDRIVIFRDTLLRDFGHDPALLRAQVTRTLRHELAHHLGWDEPGVRGLGL
jgi:predicted Zn-dependent protease with MMP-like domain